MISDPSIPIIGASKAPEPPVNQVPQRNIPLRKRELVRAIKDMAIARGMPDGGRIEIFADEHVCAKIAEELGCGVEQKSCAGGMLKFRLASVGKYEVAVIWGHQLNVDGAQRRKEGGSPMASLLDVTDIKKDGTRGDYMRHLHLVFDL